MTLTPEGRTLVEHARHAVHSLSSDIGGEVALGLPTTVALVATLPILQATRARFKHLKLKIIESHSGFLGEWL